jgi:hypothetical protein
MRALCTRHGIQIALRDQCSRVIAEVVVRAFPALISRMCAAALFADSASGAWSMGNMHSRARFLGLRKIGAVYLLEPSVEIAKWQHSGVPVPRFPRPGDHNELDNVSSGLLKPGVECNGVTRIRSYGLRRIGWFLVRAVRNMRRTRNMQR